MKLADVHRQAAGLDDGAVGPTVGGQGEAAVGDNAAAGIGDVGQGDVEGATADVQQGTADVLQTARRQAELEVGGFQGAVAVVQQALHGQLSAAAGAQGAQLATAVVQ
ncbi:hypothetical protein FQZ97_1074740 [compost metagenome]